MLKVNDLDELYALNGTMWTLKFDSEPEAVSEYAGSPRIANVCNRVYEALIRGESEKGREGNAHRLVKGRSAEENTAVTAAMKRFLRLNRVQVHWNSWTENEKHEYVRILLAPYLASPTLMKSLVAYGDREPHPD